MVNGCTRAVKCRALCRFHYRRQQLGIPLDAPVRARRGSGHVAKDGYRYVCCYSQPNARANGMLAEHRLIMSNVLGRALHDDETVHLVNGMRTDNRPENLELWSKGQPAGQRVVDKLAWARELLNRYGTAAERAAIGGTV
jgi:hypothetical protein